MTNTRQNKARFQRQKVRIKVKQWARARVKHGNAIAINANFIKVRQTHKRNKKRGF